jgi:hypothetical protein
MPEGGVWMLMETPSLGTRWWSRACQQRPGAALKKSAPSVTYGRRAQRALGPCFSPCPLHGLGQRHGDAGFGAFEDLRTVEDGASEGQPCAPAPGAAAARTDSSCQSRPVPRSGAWNLAPAATADPGFNCGSCRSCVARELLASCAFMSLRQLWRLRLICRSVDAPSIFLSRAS